MLIAGPCGFRKLCFWFGFSLANHKGLLWLRFAIISFCFDVWIIKKMFCLMCGPLSLISNKQI